MANGDMDDLAGRLEALERNLAGHDGPAAPAGREACALVRILLAENQTLGKALRFYADCTNWHRDFIGGAHVDSRAMDDMGQTAREALGQVK